MLAETGSGGMRKTETDNASTSPNNGSHIENSTNFVLKCSSLKQSFNNNFKRLFDFNVSDVSNFEKFAQFLYRPSDPASLGVARALFGKSINIDNNIISAYNFFN